MLNFALNDRFVQSASPLSDYTVYTREEKIQSFRGVVEPFFARHGVSGAFTEIDCIDRPALLAFVPQGNPYAQIARAKSLLSRFDPPLKSNELPGICLSNSFHVWKNKESAAILVFSTSLDLLLKLVKPLEDSCPPAALGVPARIFA